ncbi:hypothetical protein [Leeia aquatica]|uniref:ADP ribosyltransferase domain-containing protein n=1 Tax=Leeia aquatica TaxID=2725557 RepID=A0A847RT05_9NEIS|nr:hypothetical protein [Leeia aquatica]NLR74340.1 hypothetical protein [Leeia aquatica]
MNFPIINVFDEPYEVREMRELSNDEFFEKALRTGKISFTQRQHIIETINNHYEAAHYMLRVAQDNSLESHIDRALENSFSKIMNHMQKTLPNSISTYQSSYPDYDIAAVSNDIKRFGGLLHQGQVLFHGGYCRHEVGETLSIDRPLSTSFCPQIALRNAEWREKAYDADEVNIFVLTVSSTTVKAYVLPLTGKFGHEKEVLISPGITLTVKKKTLVRNDYAVRKSNYPEKSVSAYIIEIDLE